MNSDTPVRISINLSGAPKTGTDLEVYARLNDREYPAKLRVTDLSGPP